MMISVVGFKQRSSPICYWKTERDRSRANCFLTFYTKSWTNLQFKCDDAAKQITAPSCYAVLDAPSCGQFSALVCVFDASCYLKGKVLISKNSTNGLEMRNLGAYEVESEGRERMQRQSRDPTLGTFQGLSPACIGNPWRPRLSSLNIMRYSAHLHSTFFRPRS